MYCTKRFINVVIVTVIAIQQIHIETETMSFEISLCQLDFHSTQYVWEIVCIHF